MSAERLGWRWVTVLSRWFGSCEDERGSSGGERVACGVLVEVWRRGRRADWPGAGLRMHCGWRSNLGGEDDGALPAGVRTV